MCWIVHSEWKEKRPDACGVFCNPVQFLCEQAVIGGSNQRGRGSSGVVVIIMDRAGGVSANRSGRRWNDSVLKEWRWLSLGSRLLRFPHRGGVGGIEVGAGMAGTAGDDGAADPAPPRPDKMKFYEESGTHILLLTLTQLPRLHALSNMST